MTFSKGPLTVRNRFGGLQNNPNEFRLEEDLFSCDSEYHGILIMLIYCLYLCIMLAFDRHNPGNYHVTFIVLPCHLSCLLYLSGYSHHGDNIQHYGNLICKYHH